MIELEAWWAHLLWILAAAGLGFLVTALFAGRLKLRRAWFLLPYVLIMGAFLLAYLDWSEIDLLAEFRQGWAWGLAGGAIAGVVVVQNVLAQTYCPRHQGLELFFELLWFGGVYGILDALLLSVMPVLATWQAFTKLGWTENWPGLVATGIVAFFSSTLVTVAYHLGYPEFQGIDVLAPVTGNGLMSLAYILTQNPLAAALSHIAMHVTAVLHGRETAVQLPPHY